MLIPGYVFKAWKKSVLIIFDSVQKCPNFIEILDFNYRKIKFIFALLLFEV